MDLREHVKQGNRLYLGIILMYIVVNMGVQVIASAFHVRFTYLQLLLIAQIGYALPAILYVAKKKQPLRESIRLKKLNLLTVLLLVVFAFSVMPLMTLLNMLSLLISRNHIQSTVNGMLNQTNFFLCLFAIGILPAILEEFVYRGAIYNQHRKGNVKKAILCSGLFFGLLHMNINQFSYAFVMGIVLAMVVEATGSILGSMIVHATINGFSVTISKLQPYFEAKMQKMTGETIDAAASISRESILAMLPSYIRLAVIATLFAGFLLFLIMKYNDRVEEVRRSLQAVGEDKMEKRNVPFLDLSFVLAVSIAVGLMLAQEFWT